MHCTQHVTTLRYAGDSITRQEDVVVTEYSLSVIVNDQEFATLLCSPVDLDTLTVGFLASEGVISGKKDIHDLRIDEQQGTACIELTSEQALHDVADRRVIASGGGRGGVRVETAALHAVIREQPFFRLSGQYLLSLSQEFLRHSSLHQATGGVHSAALCNADGIRMFAEDIGRHNTLDKIFGRCLLTDYPLAGHFIFSSGRVSSEMLLKVARQHIPLMVSKSAPTHLGVQLADELGITLIGFARGTQMNVYTHDWRIQEGSAMALTRHTPG